MTLKQVAALPIGALLRRGEETYLVVGKRKTRIALAARSEKGKFISTQWMDVDFGFSVGTRARFWRDVRRVA